MRWLLVIASACGLIAMLEQLRGRTGWTRILVSPPILPIVGLWGLRLLVAFLGLPGSRNGGSLLNPANFAMVGSGACCVRRSICC
jgi:hypothetical protein